MTTQQVLLPTGGGSLASVRVHPVALFTICDAFLRRSEKQERVIGTLLGGMVEPNVLEVKSCYVVPHSESAEQVAVDIAHHKTMFDLHQRVSPSDTILGWFATGSTMFNSDSLIQEFYSKETGTPIHLKVDTTMANKKFSVNAYQFRVLALGEKVLATEFTEIPCEVLFQDVERAGVELMSSSGSEPKAVGEGESLLGSVKRLEGLLENVHAYVNDVVEGRQAGDVAIGRYLADTMAIVPRFSRAEFERMFNESVQDSVMVSYLANLMRAQIALAEKLGTSQLPIM